MSTDPTKQTTDTTTTASYLTWLEVEGGYSDVRLLPSGRWAAIAPFLFTAAIVTGRLGDMVGYDDRWCYHHVGSARAALNAWSGEGEPQGWHRHPATGRRVTDDGSEEVYT